LARNSKKIHYAQKLLQILDSMWWSMKIIHDSKVVAQGSDAGGAEAMPREIQILDSKFALLQVDGHPPGS
jgi:hypothetical protein